MSKNISDLREALFATLEAVKSGTLDTDKARAVNEIAKTIVDTAKVEVDFLKITGGDESDFIESPDDDAEELPPGITGRTVHRLKG
jgi:hypothetical protein